ncbi:MAG: MAPEG family protein [Stellaceae bacterium]
MTVPFIVPAYAGVLALVYLALSLRVSQLRRRGQVAVGSGQDRFLLRAIRAHANFGEYVPLALILLGFLEMQRGSAILLHALCLLLLFGRLAHAFGISREPDLMPLRAVGMLATYVVLIVPAIVLIADWSRAAAL